MRKLRPVDQTEIGRRAFVELVAEEHSPAWLVIWERASDGLKQHYFDRHISKGKQEYLRALIERGPPPSVSIREGDPE